MTTPTTNLVPYYDLPEGERNAIFDWLIEHGLDPHDISAIIPPIHNADTSEWTFTRLVRAASGHTRADHNGEHPSEQVTVKATRELIWRTA